MEQISKEQEIAEPLPGAAHAIPFAQSQLPARQEQIDLKALSAASGIDMLSFANPTRYQALQYYSIVSTLARLMPGYKHEVTHAEVTTDPHSDWDSGITDAQTETASVVEVSLCMSFSKLNQADEDEPESAREARSNSEARSDREAHQNLQAAYEKFAEHLRSHEGFIPTELRSIKMTIGFNYHKPGLISISQTDILYSPDRDFCDDDQEESDQSIGGYTRESIEAFHRFRTAYAAAVLKERA